MKNLIDNTTASLLAQINFHGPFEIHPLQGGANNQVYRVDANGSQWCLKAYFQHEDDSRDRLSSEFSFLHFAWNKGVRAIPEPYIKDADNRIALYEFIPGRRLQTGEVTLELVQQALDFYCELNRYIDEVVAKTLPKASEFCCSVAAHLQQVCYRINRLKAVEDTCLINREAIQFISNDLLEKWQVVLHSTPVKAARLHLNLRKETPQTDWRLSPSDFGFHNAIFTSGGKLRFIDFEYAGWDDPGRLVCDFFCQPAVPVPLDYFELVAETVATGLSAPEKQIQRMKLLLAVYQIKWCCILLNDFLPTDAERRRFSRRKTNQDDRKALQLQKARNALKRLSVQSKYFSIEPEGNRCSGISLLSAA